MMGLRSTAIALAAMSVLFGFTSTARGQASDATAPTSEPLRQEGSGYTRRPRWVGTLRIEDAVRLAQAESLRVAMARQDAAGAAARTLLASAAGRLKASASVVGAAQDLGMIYPGAVDPIFYAKLPDRNVVDANAMIMLPILTGGGLDAALKSARASEKASLARLAWTLVDVSRDARRSYARAVLARERADITVWAVAEQTENLRLAERRFKAGSVPRSIVMRAAAELAGARREVNVAKAEAVREDAELKMTLSVDLASVFAYPPLSVPPAHGGDEADDVRASLASRADLEAARLDVDAATQAVRQARARYSPQAYAAAMLERIWPGMEGRGSEGGYSIGAVFSVPLVDGGERRAEVRMAEAEQRRRALEVEALELEATVQVRQARAALSAAEANVGLAGEEVAAAREDLRVARLRFDIGRAIYLEVLDSQEALARARYAQAESSAAAVEAEADLLRAMGRLEAAP